MEEIWNKIKTFLMRFAYFKKRSRLNRYGVTLILFLIILVLSFIMSKTFINDILNTAAPFLILTLVVTISSWYGGIGPGIIATLLTVITNNVIFFRSDHNIGFSTENIFLNILLILEGLIISIISEARYEKEEQKDQFIGYAAHELKNPLSSIRGFAGLIVSHSSLLKDEKIQNYAEEIEIQSDKLLELINDLLDITKIEIGKFSYKYDYFDIDHLVREIVDHQKIISRHRKIELSGSYKKVVRGDRFRIGQVLTNLLSNALKYSPKTSKVKVKIKKEKKGILISVKDEGIGIPKPEQSKIFSEFFRTKKAQKSTEGLGLGLFISHQIVKVHKGRLWFKSNNNKGTTFYFWLPIFRE